MGFITSSPYTGPKEIKYLFIDGGYLDIVLEKMGKTFFDIEKLPISYEKLSSDYTKTFYYHSLPSKKKNQSKDDYDNEFDKKKAFFNSLKMINGYHVYEGISRYRKGQQMQKGVDTMIAIDILRHSFRKNMHKATLLAGDLDFKPLLDALVLEGMFVKLMYEKNSTSDDLIFSADALERISIKQLYTYTSDKFKSKYKLPLIKKNIELSFLHKEMETIRNGKIGNLDFTLGTKNKIFYFIVFLEENNTYYSESHKEKVLTAFYEDHFGEKIHWH